MSEKESPKSGRKGCHVSQHVTMPHSTCLANQARNRRLLSRKKEKQLEVLKIKG